MEMPKTKEEFECLMKARMNRQKWETGFSYTMLCNDDGSPIPEEKRAFCEMQKMVLGSETAYMFCGVVTASLIELPALGNTPGVRMGSLIREVYIRMSEKEHDEWRPLFPGQIAGKKAAKDRGGKGFMAPSTGEACAFPGGCE